MSLKWAGLLVGGVLFGSCYAQMTHQHQMRNSAHIHVSWKWYDMYCRNVDVMRMKCTKLWHICGLQQGTLTTFYHCKWADFLYLSGFSFLAACPVTDTLINTNFSPLELLKDKQQQIFLWKYKLLLVSQFPMCCGYLELNCSLKMTKVQIWDLLEQHFAGGLTVTKMPLQFSCWFPQRPQPHILNQILVAGRRIRDIQMAFLTGLAEAQTRHSLLS